ncbi:MAG: diaminopimelate epimerase [Treponema sp.]|jgi:diaminopimelate epimerase|nr:diaminopimelate epimerase [Treponema sp.]
MNFYKLQGAGNDFIVVNNIKERIPEEKISAIAGRICTRKRSLGADGLLLVGAPRHGGDISVRVFNSDGSESEMCGNGMRCVARYAFEETLLPAGSGRIVIETMAGDIEAWRLSRRSFKIRLQSPSVLENGRSLSIQNRVLPYTYIELGNPGIPHIVLEEFPGKVPEPARSGGEDFSPEGLRELARTLRFHPDFPKGTNVNFWRLREDGGADLLTYERGVEDFTLACGTGAGSTALALKHRGTINGERVSLFAPGGLLVVDVVPKEDAGYDLFLTGDTNFVARGEILDDDL